MRPRKKRPMVMRSTPSEQLNTRQNCPQILLRFFTVSVLPVPAGPSGPAPYWCRHTQTVTDKNNQIREHI
eukprot:649825-Pyramimonas_sp.AAC.1